MAEPMGEVNAAKEPAADTGPGSPGRRPRRGLLWTILGAVVVLLVAAAFVGGRLLAQRRLVPPAGLLSVKMELPPEVPQEAPAAMGLVGKIEGKVVVVEEMEGGGGGGGPMIVGGGPIQGGGGVVTRSFGMPGGEEKQTEVVITNGTRFYKTTPPSQEEIQSGGGTMKVESAAFEDLQSGQMIQVWGEKSGGRVTAEVVLINVMAELRVGP